MTKIVHSLASLNDKMGGFAGRNLVMNGDFQVNQRGTTLVTVADGVPQYTADRWASNGSAGSVEIVAPTENDGKGSTLKLTTVANSNTYARQGIEWSNQFIPGKKFTVSFEARSALSAAVKQRLVATDDIQQLTNLIPEIYNTNIDLTPDYVKYSYTVVIPEGIPIEANIMVVDFTAATQNTDVEIRQVQMEPGEVATDFEIVPVATQLARCQRYCVALSQYTIFNGYTDASGSAAQATIDLTTSMRTVPVFESTPSFSSFHGDGSVRDTMTVDTILFTYPGPLRFKFAGAGLPINNVVSLRVKAAAVLSADYT